MQINKLQDIDLSKYKLAYFQGDSLGHDQLCQNEVMALGDGGGITDNYGRLEVSIALIPKKARLTECGGDDWDDVCARDNATGFYDYPKGTIFLRGKLGGELKLVKKL